MDWYLCECKKKKLKNLIPKEESRMKSQVLYHITFMFCIRILSVCFPHSFHNKYRSLITDHRPAVRLHSERKTFATANIFIMVFTYCICCILSNVSGVFIKSPLYIILLVYKHHRTPINQSFEWIISYGRFRYMYVLYTFDQCLNYQYLFGTFNTCRKRVLFAIFALAMMTAIEKKAAQKKKKTNPPKMKPNAQLNEERRRAMEKQILYTKMR